MSLTRMHKLSLLSCLGLVAAGGPALQAQSSITSVGKPTGSLTIPVENGFINVQDGNLHLDIPFATQQQRGNLVQHAGFVYDSGIWHGVATSNGNQWMPTNVTTYEGTPSLGGWRYVDQAQDAFTSSSYSSGTVACQSGNGAYQIETAFLYTDPLGTVHTFPIETISMADPTCGTGTIVDTPNGANYAIDGSGYYAEVMDYSMISVWDPSGNQVVQSYNGGMAVHPYMDPNGNFWDLASLPNPKDDRDQQDVLVSQNGSNPNIYYYDVLTTYAQRARYTVTIETINLKTNFLAASVGSDFTGTMQVVESIGLPDGSTYGFTYENGTYGELTGITLPTGASVSYVYLSGVKGTRAGENVPPRWVSQHVGASGTTAFSIVPTLCNNKNTLLCNIETNTVSRSGNKEVYVFQLQQGFGDAYLNTQITTAPGANASVYESLVTKGYYLTTPCPASYCSPSNPNSNPTLRYVWPLPAGITTTLANGLQAATLYKAYAAPGSGVPLDVQQWDYYTPTAGAPPGPPAGLLPTRRSVSTVLEYMNGLPLIGQVAKYDATGAMISRTSTSYDEPAYLSTSNGVTHHQAVPAPNGNVTTTTEWWNTNNSTLTKHFYHDDTGALLETKDANGNMTYYAYDPTDTFITKTSYPLGLTAQDTYDSSTGQILTSLDANSRETSYTYDSLGRPSTVTRPDGGSGTTTYPSVNETDVSDLQSSGVAVNSVFTTDGFGRSSSSTHDTTQTGITYDTQGRILCDIGAHGTSGASSTDGQTCFKYDTLDRVTTITKPDKTTVTVAYASNTVTTTDELKHPKASTYNAFRQLSAVTEPDLTGVLNWISTYTYNGLGEITNIVQKGGSTAASQWRTRTFSYDSLGQMYARSSPEAGSDTFAFDNNGNILTITNANGATTTYTYDALNRPKTKVLSSGVSYAYAYDGNDQSADPNGKGQLTSASNGSNVGFYMTHDTVGRLASEKYCLPSDCSYTQAVQASYDYHGNMVALTYPDGRGINSGYDSLDRLVATGEFSEHTESSRAAIIPLYQRPRPYFSNAVYYPVGELNSATYGNVIQLTSTFNDRQNVTALSYAQGTKSLWSKSYTWDKNAVNLTSIKDNISKDVRTFTYDYVNRLATAQDSTQGIAAPATGSHGSVTITGTEYSSYQCPNGPPCTLVWDSGTVSITVNGIAVSVNYGQGSTDASLALALASALNTANPAITASASGATISIVSKATGGATNYPLVAAPYPAVNGVDFALAASGAGLTGGADATSGGLSDTYAIDAWGNRQETGTFTFTQPFGTTNQITATGYKYDLAGHLSTDGLGNTYTYDAEGKMSASNGALYTRDPLGQRVRKDFSGAATEYYYFGGTLLATRNPASTQWTDYIYAGGRLVAEIPVGSTDMPFYRIGDHLDSLAQKTDSNGNVLGSNDLSPWGELVDSSAENRLLFTQHERDTENNSDATLYRQYASDQGRWLSPDPINGSYDLYDPQSFNRYAYLGNRPNNTTDPLGLDPGDCILCTIAIDAGAAALFHGLEKLFEGRPHLPGEQTDPSSADTSAADSGLPGDTVGQPDWNQPVLNEQLGLPPSIAAQLGSGGLLGALGLPSNSCDFGACGSSAVDPNQIEQHHVFAQQFAEWFQDHDLEDELVKLTIPLSAAAHRLRVGPGVHTTDGGDWNGAWRQWIDEHPNATPQEIINQAKKLLLDFGIGTGDVFSDVFTIVSPCVIDPLASYCSGGRTHNGSL